MNSKNDNRRINFPMLARVVGWLLMIESAFIAFPLLVCLYYGESDWRGFAITIALTLIVGFGLNKYIRPRRSSMGKREGFLLTALIWVVFSIFGMVPFLLSATPLDLSDAFFEAMAGFTTTGCTSYPSAEQISHGLAFWQSFMQWIGGMGIILFTLAVIPMLNHSGGMQMFNAEVTGITHDKIRPRISNTAKSLWLVYICLTVICALLLWAGPMSLFDAICHALGTLSTGGVTTRDLGVASWDSAYADIVVTVFMFLGGTNFRMIFLACTGNFKPLKSNGALRLYVCLVAIYFVIFSINAFIAAPADYTVKDITVYPLFQVVATMTSTGYTAPHLSTWGPMVFTLLLPMMFFGACAGSTAGGAKLDRLLVLVKFLRNSLKRALKPNTITSVKVNGQVLDRDIVAKTISVLSMLCLLIGIGALLLATMGVPLGDSLFSSLSCASNLGLGPDMVGGHTLLTDVPAGGKWVLAALMLIGRLEVFTVLILFTPDFWRD